MAFLKIEHPKIMNQGLLFKLKESENTNVLAMEIQTIIGDVKGTVTMGYDGRNLIVVVKHSDSMDVSRIPIKVLEE